MRDDEDDDHGDDEEWRSDLFPSIKLGRDKVQVIAIRAKMSILACAMMAMTITATMMTNSNSFHVMSFHFISLHSRFILISFA